MICRPREAPSGGARAAPAGPYRSAFLEVPFEEAGVRLHLEVVIPEHRDELAVLLIRSVLVVLHGNSLDARPIGRVEVAQDIVFGALAVELQVIDGFQPVLVHDAAEGYLRDGHALAWSRRPREQSREPWETTGWSMREPFIARIGHQLYFVAVAAGRRVQNGDVLEGVSRDIELHAGERARVRLDRHDPPLRDLRRRPQDEHADIAADVEHGIARPELEARMQIALSGIDFPPQERRDRPHRGGGEMTGGAVGKLDFDRIHRSPVSARPLDRP